MDRARSIVLLAVAVLSVAGCGGARDVATDGPAAGGTEATTVVSPSADATPVSACLDISATGNSVVEVDWVDFVELHGIQYLAPLEKKVPSLSPDQLGPVWGRVECEVSVLTFSKEPGPAVDGDAAFLPVGTEVHAVEGFEPTCRVAAKVDGEIRVYVALAESDHVTRAVPCAKAPRRLL